MGKPRTHDPYARIREIARLRAAGMSRQFIIAELGLTVSNFTWALKDAKRLGIPMPPAPRVRRFNACWTVKAAQMLRDGFSRETIASACGRTRKQVAKFARRVGIAMSDQDKARNNPPPPPKPETPAAKFETVEEYLARGGKITKCPSPWRPGQGFTPEASIPWHDPAGWLARHLPKGHRGRGPRKSRKYKDGVAHHA